MKFKEGQLIQFIKFDPSRLRLLPRPLLRLRPLLRPPLHPRPRPRLGVIVEAIEASEAWENYYYLNKEEQKQIPNCYIVFWQNLGKEELIYENEVEEANDSRM